MGIFDKARELLGLTDDAEPDVRDFDDVRDEFKFTGFSEDQEAVILEQLERVWETESGREMLEDGFNNNGLHYLNMNDQGVISSVAPTVGMTADKVGEIGNFALPTKGEIYLNGYAALDADGSVQTYSGLHANLDGQEAAAVTPIRSLDENGEIFSVPPIYTMIHETNHVARNESDLPRTRANGVEYDPSLVGTTSAEAAGAYGGQNEISTREILTEMGIDQQRGSYGATGGLNDVPIGTDYGLGRSHDVSVTTVDGIDMTGHSSVDGIVVGYTAAEIQAAVADQGGTFTDAQSLQFVSNTYKMGDAADTVHAFDGNDVVHTGAGDDRIFLGGGDDVAIAGWGANTIDGGDANVDPTSDHLSDKTTDWGFDRVDYRSLPAGFASPDALQVDTSFDGVVRDGVLITINADDIYVTKGQENAVRMGQDVDGLHNIDGVIGTHRADLTQVDAISGDQTVDAAGGFDTLRFGSGLTHTEGAVTFNGVVYEGVLSDGTNSLYHRGHEDVVSEVEEATKVEADKAADHHVERNGTESAGVPPIDASLDGAQPQSLPIEDAVRILKDDGAAAVEQETEYGISNGPISNMIETPAGLSVMETLFEQGEQSVDVDAAALNSSSAYTRVGAILESAMSRVQYLDRDAEVEARTADHIDKLAEIGADVGVEHISAEVPSPEVEAQYDYSL